MKTNDYTLTFKGASRKSLATLKDALARAYDAGSVEAGDMLLILQSAICNNDDADLPNHT